MRAHVRSADLRPRSVAGLAAFLLLALPPAAAFAQDPGSDEPESQEAEKPEEETDFLERRIGDNWILSPVVFPIVSPESGFALAIGGVATFSTQPENEELPRSTIGLFALPATNGSLGFNADFTGFFADDRFRVELELDYDDGTDNYWGVGYERPRAIGGEDEEVTELERVAFELPVILSWRVGRSLFAGINFDLISMEVDERSPTQETDPHFLTFGDEILNVGAGVQLTFDSRDETVDAYTGRYFNLEATFYSDSFGSDQDFETYELDYRSYHPVGRPGRTLAWQVSARLAEGDVPWTRMPTVGSSADLRGYTQGRFRDLAAAWALVEYRHMTNKKLWKLGRQGFAVWGGIGFIGEDLGDFGGHELPNVGVGYRLEVQPRRNLRLDVGWGYDEIGFYLNFTEAF